jgi:hypothetical protein
MYLGDASNMEEVVLCLWLRAQKLLKAKRFEAGGQDDG